MSILVLALCFHTIYVVVCGESVPVSGSFVSCSDMQCPLDPFCACFKYHTVLEKDVSLCIVVVCSNSFHWCFCVIAVAIFLLRRCIVYCLIGLQTMLQGISHN